MAAATTRTMSGPSRRGGALGVELGLGRPAVLRSERWPPRCPEDMSWVEDRLAVLASPERARSLLTVRAAISSAQAALSPRSLALSLMCSYRRIIQGRRVGGAGRLTCRHWRAAGPQLHRREHRVTGLSFVGTVPPRARRRHLYLADPGGPVPCRPALSRLPAAMSANILNREVIAKRELARATTRPLRHQCRRPPAARARRYWFADSGITRNRFATSRSPAPPGR